nr:hypothetical protein [Serratia fonticola]
MFASLSLAIKIPNRPADSKKPLTQRDTQRHVTLTTPPLTG